MCCLFLGCVRCSCCAWTFTFLCFPVCFCPQYITFSVFFPCCSCYYFVIFFSTVLSSLLSPSCSSRWRLLGFAMCEPQTHTHCAFDTSTSIKRQIESCDSDVRGVYHMLACVWLYIIIGYMCMELWAWCSCSDEHVHCALCIGHGHGHGHGWILQTKGPFPFPKQLSHNKSIYTQIICNLNRPSKFAAVAMTCLLGKTNAALRGSASPSYAVTVEPKQQLGLFGGCTAYPAVNVDENVNFGVDYRCDHQRYSLPSAWADTIRTKQRG